MKVCLDCCETVSRNTTRACSRIWECPSPIIFVNSLLLDQTKRRSPLPIRTFARSKSRHHFYHINFTPPLKIDACNNVFISIIPRIFMLNLPGSWSTTSPQGGIPVRLMKGCEGGRQISTAARPENPPYPTPISTNGDLYMV